MFHNYVRVLNAAIRVNKIPFSIGAANLFCIVSNAIRKKEIAYIGTEVL